MASSETLYVLVGQALEVSQLLEIEIGTALLALDALKTKSYLNPNPDEYTRLREAIEGKTLGQSLRKMKSKLGLQDDLEAQLTAALKARNHLAHGFFKSYGLAILEDDGRDKMITELQELFATLQTAYTVAGNVSHALVDKVQRLQLVSAANRCA